MIRALLRWALVLLYTGAGYAHIAEPGPFIRIMPGWIPSPGQVVFWTGLAELAGAGALAQPWSNSLRKAGAIGLALYAICVFPANINHFALDMARTDGGSLGLGYHLPRLIAQPVIVWLALWSGDVIDWPVKRRPTD